MALFSKIVFGLLVAQAWGTGPLPGWCASLLGERGANQVALYAINRDSLSVPRFLVLNLILKNTSDTDGLDGRVLRAELPKYGYEPQEPVFHQLITGMKNSDQIITVTNDRENPTFRNKGVSYKITKGGRILITDANRFYAQFGKAETTSEPVKIFSNDDRPISQAGVLILNRLLVGGTDHPTKMSGRDFRNFLMSYGHSVSNSSFYEAMEKIGGPTPPDSDTSKRSTFG